MKTYATIVLVAWVCLPGTAAASTCDDIMALVGSGKPADFVVAEMVRVGRMDAGTVQCLRDRGAPAAVLAAANALLPSASTPKVVASPPTPAVAAPPPSIEAPSRPIPRVPPKAAPPPAASAPAAVATPPSMPPRTHHPVDVEPSSWQGPLLDPGASETYTDHGVNPFTETARDGLSTFAADVDSGSYTMTRRKLREGYLPPEAAVRTEEFVNYLPYDYARPPDGDPFGVNVEMARTPWRDTWTVAIGIQGKKVSYDTRKPVHLTFLVDTSGSMQSPDKMALVKRSLTMLTEELEDGDTVALVVYAGSAGLVLPHTPISQRSTILAALGRLEAGGSTAMGAGIALAYEEAERAYREGAVNRVIIASDGDANVGPSDHGSLSDLIHEHAEAGITLTTLGFGDGNYRDTTMEQIADDGDGNYFYIDSEQEARRVLVDKMTSTLEVIAKDVKIQVAWSPKTVSAYRLIGYENRDVADRDFRDDRVDGGEIGAGHQVTALYEVELTGIRGPLGDVRIRNMAPGPDAPAVERTYPLAPRGSGDLDEASAQLRMQVAAASFAEILRASNYVEDTTLADVHRLAVGAARAEYPEDQELVDLVRRAAELRGELAVTRSR